MPCLVFGCRALRRVRESEIPPHMEAFATGDSVVIGVLAFEMEPGVAHTARQISLAEERYFTSTRPPPDVEGTMGFYYVN